MLSSSIHAVAKGMSSFFLSQAESFLLKVNFLLCQVSYLWQYIETLEDKAAFQSDSICWYVSVQVAKTQHNKYKIDLSVHIFKRNILGQF